MTEAEAIYRVVWVCTLRQRTALSIGGSPGPGTLRDGVDALLDMDGAGRWVLRGRSLAGALLATARSLYSDATALEGLADDTGIPSGWRVGNAHTIEAHEALAKPTVRAHVGLRQDTRKQSPGSLRDLEVLPSGLEWSFCIEIAPPQPMLLKAWQSDAKRWSRVLAEALAEWQRGRCWLGRKVARGLGWMELIDCQAFILTRRAVDQWPDASLRSRAEELERLKDLATADLAIPVNIQDCRQRFADGPYSPKPTRHYVRWRGHLGPGPYVPEPGGKSYGHDGLAIGAHARTPSAASYFDGHLQAVPDREDPLGGFAPDAAMALQPIVPAPAPSGSPEAAWVWQPYVPGTSLAGSLRHWLSARARQQNEYVVDAVTKEGATYTATAGERLVAAGPIESLLGIVHKPAKLALGSRLLISDATLCGDSWTAMQRHHVALDPTTQAPFGSGKFTRLALLEAKFAWEFILELDDAPDESTEAQGQIARVDAFITQAQAGHVAIGSGEFRSMGHVRWSEVTREHATAGSSWSAYPQVKEAQP